MLHLPLLLATLGCVAPAEPPPAAGTPMHGRHARRTASPDGAWEALVSAEGELTLRPFGQPERAEPVDSGALPELTFTPEALIYARETPHNEADLWWVSLDGGQPEQLTDWPGTESRPAASPDGGRVAFVSGRTGVASLWTLDLSTGEATQLTNVGLERAPRAPGSPPRGFVPPPDPATLRWDEQGLSWVALRQRWSVSP